MLFTILACAASALLLTAGWLAGVRRGAHVRRELAEDVAAESRRANDLAERLAEHHQDAEARALVESVLQPMAAREEETRSLENMVRSVLGPLAARERIGWALSTIEARTAAHRDLPDLLDTIAQRSGLGTMLLCDEAGLPLASTSSSTLANDTLAAMSALLLNLVDRIEAAGSPAPFSAVFRDEANQVILHRVFSVGKERFVLSAATSGRAMTPDDLDPALDRVVHALTPSSAESH